MFGGKCSVCSFADLFFFSFLFFFFFLADLETELFVVLGVSVVNQYIMHPLLVIPAKKSHNVQLTPFLTVSARVGHSLWPNVHCPYLIGLAKSYCERKTLLTFQRLSSAVVVEIVNRRSVVIIQQKYDKTAGKTCHKGNWQTHQYDRPQNHVKNEA